MASVSKTNEQDIITFAAKALQEFSRIATGLSVKEERHCLGALGAQAFLICLYLNVSEDLREEWLGRKLPKLLKDLCLFVCGGSDQGCSFSMEPNWKKPMCLHLISLSQATRGTDRHKEAQSSVEKGLLAISSGDQKDLKYLIAHVDKLIPYLDDALDFTEAYPSEEMTIRTSFGKKATPLDPVHLFQALERCERISEVNDILNIRSKESKKAEKWLNQVDSLIREMRKANPSTPKRVRIAILDTGYDPDTPFFLRRERRIAAWRDWVDADPSPSDFHGHGTHMLGLIMRIAPQADIYVARVAKTPEDLENVERVAEAIGWAQRECKADIISTSFGYMEDQLPIAQAIETAIRERDGSVLFFAAAANSGANTAQLFPARHQSVISIRATTSKGYIADFNPPLDPDEATALATLGVEVPSAPLSHFTDQKASVRSGTSIANAISVGIAGMLLFYVNQQWYRPSYNDINSKVVTKNGLLAMLENISTPSIHKEFLYIKPWCLKGLSHDTLWAQFEDVLLGSGASRPE